MLFHVETDLVNDSHSYVIGIKLFQAAKSNIPVIMERSIRENTQCCSDSMLNKGNVDGLCIELCCVCEYRSCSLFYSSVTAQLLPDSLHKVILDYIMKNIEV